MEQAFYPKMHIYHVAIKDKLKTKVELHVKQIIPHALCPLCGSHPETVNHLFFCLSSEQPMLDETSSLAKMSF